MGMAASQARYLQLTARKTNVEYEGQQINQQRTELANESAGIFNQLLDMQVPTAPSTQDYSETIYTFYDGDNNCTISSMIPISGAVTGQDNYNVTYYYNKKVNKGIGKTRTDLGVMGNGTVANPYWLTDGTTTKKTQLAQCLDSDPTTYSDNYAAILQICQDNADSTLRTTCGYDPDTVTLTTTEGAYYYKGTNGTVYYYSESDLADSTSPTGAPVRLTAYYASQVDEKQYVTSDAYVQAEDSGRYSKITLDGVSTTFDLTATTTTDTNAYEDAVNEYEYKQTLYQQQVTALNAKTSIIEQEDRTLELKLSQLDTEQRALSTEMDSVKKVIEKNIEQTFKTFS